MKSRIFMYLFIFALLLVVFQYVNSKNIFEDYERRMEKLEAKSEVYKDSILYLENKNFELLDFSIERNEGAFAYFENAGYDIAKLIPAIEDGLYSLNDYKGDDHPIIPYASMTEGKILINQIRILNHKWIVANFSDGENWGEIFITYELDDKGNLKYKLSESFIYPPE